MWQATWLTQCCRTKLKKRVVPPFVQSTLSPPDSSRKTLDDPLAQGVYYSPTVEAPHGENPGRFHQYILRSKSYMGSSNSTSIIQQFRLHETDTGSPQVQIALLTERINHLAAHFQTHAKDFNSRQGLLKMVNRRRRLLEYLKRDNEDSYRTLLDALHLRK